MILRYFCLSVLALAGTVFAQQTPTAASQTGTTAPSAPAKASAPEPDYPEPRSLSIELFYWVPVPGSGPDIRGGKVATGYSSLFGIGKYKQGEGARISYPVTRTGEVVFDGFLLKGSGNQKAPVATTIFGTSFSKGDYLNNQYTLESGRVYLDDLLYPHKFPVSKLRFKSLWGVHYLRAKATVDALLSTVTTGTTSSSNRQVILPEFGLAMEYAVSKHVLFRVDGAGFGLPHRSLIYDGAATLSWRKGQTTIEGGFRGTGFKTSPSKDEYVQGQIYGGFVGLRYNWK